MTGLVLRQAAMADIAQARANDDGLADGLGDRLDPVPDELFACLVGCPRSATLVAGYRDLRRAVVRGFPHVMLCRRGPDRVEVLRVLHAARSDVDRPAGEFLR